MATVLLQNVVRDVAQLQQETFSARRRIRAFSMLEAMIAVAVLAVLVGLATAAITRSRQTTTMVRCISNLRLIGQGFSNYAAVNNDRLPYIKSGSPQWEDLLTTTGMKRDIHFKCPSDQEIFAFAGSSYDWRDTGPPDQDHRNSFAGRPMHAIRPDLAMSFEALPDWHKKGQMITVLVDGSIGIMDSDSFDLNYQQHALP